MIFEENTQDFYGLKCFGLFKVSHILFARFDGYKLGDPELPIVGNNISPLNSAFAGSLEKVKAEVKDLHSKYDNFTQGE